ncbi:Gfo/Idh/MocA family protein [Glaciibacter superstes]|uniref:Gfo/Idh/MocA family protein n=1 Tax=Glaciibacter superstes TaxID=501023 RepID=UPI0003B2F317|nr:Gfo/Idh/MocA family oxidoreductase [Glaciibacter superstes]
MTIRLGIVGVGKVATGNYLPHLSNIDDVELAYVSRSRTAVNAAVEAFGGTAMATANELAEWKPDAVFVLTADHAHRATVAELVDLGVPRIFVEKPLVADNGQAAVSEADFHAACELVGRARARGIQLAMNFNYRSFASVRLANSIATDREFGKVLSVAATSHFACWSHVIDLTGQLVGTVSQVTALSSAGERGGAGLVAPDLAVAFRTADDAVGTLIGTAGVAWQHPLFDVSIIYERGRIRLSDLDGTVVVHDAAANRTESSAPSHDTSRWDAYAASFATAIDAYLSSLRAEVDPPVPVRDGLVQLQFEAAVRRSLAEGRTITLARDLPLD